MSVSVIRHSTSRIMPGTFAPPLMLWSESKDKYTTGIPYREVYSEKKKGFMTGDFPRRDEFSNTIRTEQIREILKRETRGQRKAAVARDKDIAKMGTAISTASTVLQSYSPTKLPAAPLYDVVTRVPEASLKLQRDDRQAGMWYMQERRKLVEAQNTMQAPLQQTAVPAPQWYSTKIGARLVDVLVDEHGQVVEQRPTQH